MNKQDLKRDKRAAALRDNLKRRKEKMLANKEDARASNPVQSTTDTSSDNKE